LERNEGLLVAVKEEFIPRKPKNLWKKIYLALHKKYSEVSFDIILKSLADYEKEKNIVNTISFEVQEGVAL